MNSDEIENVYFEIYFCLSADFYVLASGLGIHLPFHLRLTIA